jgi:hypothetical protein
LPEAVDDLSDAFAPYISIPEPPFPIAVADEIDVASPET